MQKTIFIILILFTTTLIQLYSQNGGVSINSNGAPADPSASLDIQSTTTGLLIPRMTTAQRNAIASPAQALQIFNLTTNCLEIFINPSWHSIYCACNVPSAPVAGTHTSTITEITWNWNTVTGATGYKYNTTNDYASATDNSINTSFTQTLLTCNTTYTLYVWAYNSCGASAPLTLTQSTSACFSCSTAPVTFTYNGASVTYGIVAGQNSTCWLDRNLGATQVATAFDDANSYGDLFQWGRLDDGHQTRTSTTTTSASSTDVPGHSLFIVSSGGTLDWRNPGNDNLWQGSAGTNNPCPSGWRIPTATELNGELASWTTNDYNGAYNNSLKWTVTGYRTCYGWLDSSVGSWGSYWSSTIFNTDAIFMRITDINALTNDAYRGYGFSVRCIMD